MRGYELVKEGEIVPMVGDGTPLSRREVDRLTQLELVIERNFKGFYAVGKALAEINETRLYRQEYVTFEAYLKDVWELGRVRGYQLIEASEVVDVLQSNRNNTDGIVKNFLQNEAEIPQTEDLPLIQINEAQARELAKIKDPAAQVTLWTRALETAPEGRVTARHIRSVIKEKGCAETDKQIRQTRTYKDPGERVSDAFMAAYDALLDEINNATRENYKSTSKEAILRHIDGLYNTVHAALR